MSDKLQFVVCNQAETYLSWRPEPLRNCRETLLPGVPHRQPRQTKVRRTCDFEFTQTIDNIAIL